MISKSLPPPLLTLHLIPSIHKPLAHSFVHIHSECILISNTIANFLPPLSHNRMLDWWLDNFAAAEKGKLFIVATFIPKEGTRLPTDSDQLPACKELEDGYDMAGYAYLVDRSSETGPFRGEVLKLLVDPKFRRRGVARAVMDKIESIASEKGLTRLVLDTEVGSPAEHVYPKLGWTRLGVIPAEGISPKDGKLVDEVFFYKSLPGHPGSGEIWKGGKEKADEPYE